MTLVTLLLIACMLSILPGQLIRINLTQTAAVNLTDIFVFLTNITFFTNALLTKKLRVPSYIFPTVALFALAAIASTVISFTIFQAQEVILASLFLLRFLAFALLTVVIVNVVKKTQVQSFINLLLATGAIFTLIGFLQFLFFRNLSALEVYGWDPHINRLVSSTLDPNYTGGILTLLASLSLSLYLYTKIPKYALLTCFFTTALLLTFSRSSYFAYAASMFVLSVVKSPKVIVIPIMLFLVAFTQVPAAKDRIMGALSLDETSQSRIESWQKALQISKDYPILGVGFNNYRYAQRDYGFFEGDSQGGHSGSGVDSSFLLVLATTGIFGFTIYLAYLASILKIILKNLKSSSLALALFASFSALAIHSQFVNSLFFPQVLVLFMFLVGLKYVQDY